MTTKSIKKENRQLGPWFHNIEVAPGISTRSIAPSEGPQPIDHPVKRSHVFENVVPKDLSGCKILDMGPLMVFLLLGVQSAVRMLWRTMLREK